MGFQRRIFMSIQNPDRLDPRRRAVQDELIRRVEQLGYQPEIFFHAGTAVALAWSLPNVLEVMRRCVGCVVLATRRWTVAAENEGPFHFASEYAQIEGATAAALRLPLLLISERGLVDRGITWTGAGHPILYMPEEADVSWLSTDPFTHRFSVWRDQLAERSDVFLGYSSKARSAAQAVHLFLTERMKLGVRNWEIDFAAGGTILDEIELAARLCSGGIFLFTKDDTLAGDEMRAAPRDNVVFEAGYFAAAKGRDRVLIIREEGAKMPADLGGNIYLTLPGRDDVRAIEFGIKDFVERRL
jgi:hypothetical protein